MNLFLSFLIFFCQIVFGDEGGSASVVGGYTNPKDICEQYKQRCANKEKEELSICLIGKKEDTSNCKAKQKKYLTDYNAPKDPKDPGASEAPKPPMEVLKGQFLEAVKNCGKIVDITFSGISDYEDTVSFLKEHDCLWNEKVEIVILQSEALKEGCKTDLLMYNLAKKLFLGTQGGILSVNIKTYMPFSGYRLLHYYPSRNPATGWSSMDSFFHDSLGDNCKDEIDDHLKRIASEARKCQWTQSLRNSYEEKLNESKKLSENLSGFDSLPHGQQEQLVKETASQVAWLGTQRPVQCNREESTEPEGEQNTIQ